MGVDGQETPGSPKDPKDASTEAIRKAFQEAASDEGLSSEWQPYVDRAAQRLDIEQSRPTFPSSKRRKRTVRILVVDDDNAMCKLLESALREVGLSCDVALGGAEAIRLAERQVYDVVVADLVMPEVSGLEVVQAIRKSNSQARAIIITGHGDVETAVSALRVRADDYILKPIQIDEFLASINRSLGRQETLRDIQLTHRQLARELDQVQLQLRLKTVKGVVALAKSLEARDVYTKGHSQRVATMSVELGRALDFHGERLDDLVVGALLHDVGKIAVPDAVLLKPAALTREEFDIIRQHPKVGYDILFPFFGRSVITECALYHHERMDGKGYPGGYGNDRLPQVGRIISLCDAFDAMTTERPYRPAMPNEDARSEVEKGRGSQFDPNIADIFCDIRPYEVTQKEPPTPDGSKT